MSKQILYLSSLAFALAWPSLLAAADSQSGSRGPLTEITDSFGMKFRLIPAGEFMMGSAGDEEGRGVDEGPQNTRSSADIKKHKVRITKPYYIGVYEVTQSQWKKVMGTEPWEVLVFNQRGVFAERKMVMGTEPWKGKRNVEEGDDYPAVYVSWADAQAFAQRMTAQSDTYHYRLPTEAEWEYACRAGTDTAYFFGAEASKLGEYAWWKGNCQKEKYHHRVGQKRPNPWGLYDMSGNVWELCQDKWNRGYYDRSPETDPQGPPGWGAGRVPRGGAWNSPAIDCRSANRSYIQQDIRDRYHGLRMVAIPK